MMKVNAFTKTYDGRKVLDFPGFTFEKGKVYAVIGANGCGKSTFAKAAARVIQADKKARVTDGSFTVGYMPQKPYGFRWSVLKNIMLAEKDRDKALYFIDELSLSHLTNKSGHRLSGGETAKMALARVMMKHFDLLLLDEPTSVMDMESTLKAEKLITAYAEKEQAAVILISHSLQEAKRTADYFLFFHKGSLCEWGTKEEMLASPKKSETIRYLEFYG